jgi:hypothetical protein
MGLPYILFIAKSVSKMTCAHRIAQTTWRFKQDTHAKQKRRVQRAYHLKLSNRLGRALAFARLAGIHGTIGMFQHGAGIVISLERIDAKGDFD